MIRTAMISMALTVTGMSMTALAGTCPETGCTDKQTDAAVTMAVAESGDKTCATACSGEQAATLAVADKKSDCATACSADAAATMTVAAPAEKNGCCPLAGAATMAVAAPAADKAGSCATACSSDAATMAVAGEGEKTCATACSGEQTATTSFASWMPKMSYAVNGETISCPKSAAAKAETAHADMHFVVNGVEYADQAEAMTAHARQLETKMLDLVRIQYVSGDECVACPDKAGKLAKEGKVQYRVGPATFDCAESAIRASVMAFNAAQQVKMEYAVGEEKTACSTAAGQMADKAGCSVEYVVNGQRTPCKTSADYMKTLAAVESALKALETASATPNA